LRREGNKPDTNTKIKIICKEVFCHVYCSANSKNGLKRLKLYFASRFSSYFLRGNEILTPPLRPHAAEPSCTEEKVNLTQCLVPGYEASRFVTSERCGKEKYLLSLPGIETQFLDCPVCIQTPDIASQLLLGFRTVPVGPVPIWDMFTGPDHLIEAVTLQVLS
jgi:hypothetical protein